MNTEPNFTESEYQILVLDPSHPFYLHPSYHPCQVLVSQILTGENFNQWRRAMSLSLSAKNKLSFVTGKFNQPGETSPYLIHWQRCNDMVISWLLNTISPEISSSIIYIPLATDIWNDLNIRFTQSNGPRLYEIKKDLTSLTQNSMLVSTYFTKFKTLWDELVNLTHVPKCTCKCTCGVLKLQEVCDENMKVTSFLMGLNEMFTNIRGQLLMMNPLPNLNQALALIQQKEKQRNYTSQQLTVIPESTALLSKFNDNNQSISRFSKSTFGNKKVDPKSFKRGNLEFTYCHGTNHTRDRCYFLNGFPPKFKGSSNKENIVAAHVTASPSLNTYTPVSIVSTAPSQLLGSIASLNTTATFTPAQYQELMTLINQNHLHSTTDIHLAGPCNEEGERDW